MAKVPEVSVARLSLYARFLEEYIKEKGPQATINSQELARFLDINPHQIRKDLSYFGRFGKRGLGYSANELVSKINRILGLERKWRLCLCGLGNLGSALFAYEGFRRMNLDIVAVFDSDPHKIGIKIGRIKVMHPRYISSQIKKMDIKIAIIAVPQEAAQEVANSLVKAGIEAILNFAPIRLIVPAHVKLRNVDLATELVTLTHFLSFHRVELAQI